MSRVTARNQINLNSLADNKSNILISVNAIIITIIIAILSTRPNIVTTKFTEEDLKNKTVDLTFFGDFIRLEYDDYLRLVKEMMKDEEHLYSTMVKNQYELGKILEKKFRLIRIAYNVFMTGIIVTVIVFLLNYVLADRLG